jgi:glycosyltransferase involved in cell wall biosynthesis
MRICYVCNELPPAPAGGIGPYVRTMASALARDGHPVVVLGAYRRAYGWERDGYNVEPVMLPRAAPYAFLRPLLPRLIHSRLRQLHELQPFDVVEWPDYEGLHHTPLAGAAEILRNHGPGLSHRLHGLVRRNPLQERMEIRTMRALPCWSAVSGWFADYSRTITGAAPRRVAVIPNPVDCNLFHPPAAPRDGELVLYAGSLIPRKGVLQLVRAANIFLPRRPRALLWLVGRTVRGGHEDEILRLLDPSLADRVRILPPVPQPKLAELMGQARVFAMPSLLESFGTVWAEALACGTPVVGSRAGAGPEVVPEGLAGELPDPSSPAEIAGAIVDLLEDSRKWRNYSACARDVALARYALPRVVERTLHLYSSEAALQAGASIPAPAAGTASCLNRS